jgi:hypothetical protein
MNQELWEEIKLVVVKRSTKDEHTYIKLERWEFEESLRK